MGWRSLTEQVDATKQDMVFEVLSYPKRPNPQHILLVSLFNGVCYGPNPEAFNEARFVRANFKYCSL